MKAKLFLSLCASILFLCGCQKGTPLDVEIGKIENHIVTLEQATKIALLNTMHPIILEHNGY